MGSPSRHRGGGARSEQGPVFVARLPEPGAGRPDVLGRPERARACECIVALIDEEGGNCVSCGRTSEADILNTWNRSIVSKRTKKVA